MNKVKVVIFYLLLLIIHVAHVIEEIFGRFLVLNKVGLGWFITINGILFCIPLIFFIFVLNHKPWAYKMSIVYAGFMAIQGVLHNVETMISGKYFDGYAGGYTGIGLFIIGSLLIYFLTKAIKTRL